MLYYIASDAGYWNNTIGWVEQAGDATHFTQLEREIVRLPILEDNIRWVAFNDDEPLYEYCRRSGCGVALDDGEGYDGLCGNCADKAESD